MKSHPDTVSAMQQTSNGCELPERTAAQSEPGVIIPRSAQRTAIRQAEHAADEILTRIRELEQQRDGHVRLAGLTQETLDGLLREHAHATRHVRELTASR